MTAAELKHTLADAPVAPLPVDHWTRMETRLILYKASRLMDDLERELSTLRTRVDDPTIDRSMLWTSDLITEARAILGDLEDRLGGDRVGESRSSRV